jgi:opacity protein-like surface antigen
MKKFLGLFLSFFFLTQMVQAAHVKKALPQDTPSDTISYPWYIGVGTGVSLPFSNWDPDFYLGSITNLFAGYQLDKNFSAQLEVAEAFYSGGSVTTYNPRFIAEGKYSFEGKDFQPYVLAGPGVEFQSTLPSGSSATNLGVLVGAGLQFDLGGKSHLFVQAEYNLILGSGTAQDLPLEAGLWVGL